MTPPSPRFGPLHILDADWRQRVWKGWLRSRWMGKEDVPPTPPEGQPPASHPQVSPPERPAAEARVESSEGVNHRRAELRSRFDCLFDRLASLDDTLEAINKRFALHSIHNRRQEQRFLERLDSIGEMAERQALALEALGSAVERLEQRLERLERHGRGTNAGAPLVEPRESRSTTASRTDSEDLSDFEDAFSFRSEIHPRSSPPAPAEDTETISSGHFLHGSLSEMSLCTVLSMLELERRTGQLQVSAEDGATVTATLRAGAIVGARRREIEADPVDVVREALRYRSGHFWFRQSRIDTVSCTPRSVGSVLLEASSRNDEDARTA